MIRLPFLRLFFETPPLRSKIYEHAQPLVKQGSKALLAWLETNAASSFQEWTLAGGTGLALWLEHSILEDIGFFRTEGMVLPD